MSLGSFSLEKVVRGKRRTLAMLRGPRGRIYIKVSKNGNGYACFVKFRRTQRWLEWRDPRVSDTLNSYNVSLSSLISFVLDFIQEVYEGGGKVEGVD